MNTSRENDQANQSRREVIKDAVKPWIINTHWCPRTCSSGRTLEIGKSNKINNQGEFNGEIYRRAWESGEREDVG